MPFFLGENVHKFVFLGGVTWIYPCPNGTKALSDTRYCSGKQYKSKPPVMLVIRGDFVNPL